MYNDKMMHSPAMKAVGTAIWIIVAIGAINWGLDALGYNIFNMPFVQMNLTQFVYPFKLIIGAAGLLSLIMFTMHCMRGCTC